MLSRSVSADQSASPLEVPRRVENASDTDALLLRTMYDFTTSRALYAACELGIADALGDDALTADELAARAGLPQDSLRRLMRLLVAAEVFARDASGRYACTSLGDRLRADHEQSLRDEFCQQLEYLAFADLVPSLRASTPALGLSGGPGYYERLTGDDRGRFQRACRSRSTAVFGALLASHQWLPGEMVADLGGGLGHHLSLVLQAQPEATGVLIDRPEVIEDARSQPWSAAVEARIRFVPADFTSDSLPAADVYLLANVLHNQPDQTACALLSQIRATVPACRNLVVAEQVMPETGSHPAFAADLWMLVLLGGRERTMDEYRNLLATGGWELAGHENDPRQHGDLLTCVPM
jgi:hypothetical protein